jgi:molybdenum-dependent DNA-binding transcriptional regulator ModE
MTMAERGERGRESYRLKREQRMVALWRQLARGECLKRAAFNVGISYTTAKRYRKMA